MTEFTTTYRERFTSAVTLMCSGNCPPADMVDAWIDNTDYNHALQSFAASHGPEWVQGIVLLEAAHLLAATPEEGVDHEVVENRRTFTVQVDGDLHSQNLFRFFSKWAEKEEVPSAPVMEYQDGNNEVHISMLGTFGWALEMLRAGKFVTRRGWNGEGMYLWYMPPANVPKQWLKEPHLVALCGDKPSIEVLGTVRMRTADGKVLTGWLASQSDLFATDWELSASYQSSLL